MKRRHPVYDGIVVKESPSIASGSYLAMSPGNAPVVGKLNEATRFPAGNSEVHLSPSDFAVLLAMVVPDIWVDEDEAPVLHVEHRDIRA